MSRKANIERKTRETKIRLELDLDGQGKYKIETGIPFLDHMLSLFAKHGLFDLKIEAKGDLEVDIHHTNEDVGICLGEAVKKALGDKKGIKRFSSTYVPMDEALARVVLDISGRSSLNELSRGPGAAPPYLKVEEGYSFEDAKQFLQAFVSNSGTNMSIQVLSGRDLHHILEAIFKALGIALDQATQVDKRKKGIPSTKGKL